MATYMVDSSATVGVWTANTAYTQGQRIVPTRGFATAGAKRRVYECTTAGTSHAATEPTYDATVGNTTSDNTVVWTARAATSWTNATRFLDYVASTTNNTDLAAADVIKVDDGHSETQTVDDIAINVTSVASIEGPEGPIQILCVDKAADTTLSTGAIVAVTGTGATKELGIEGYLYVYGIDFRAEEDTFLGRSTVEGQLQTYERCIFRSTGSNSSSVGLVIGPSTGGDLAYRCRMIDCDIIVNGAAQVIRLVKVMLEMIGGTITRNGGGSMTGPMFQSSTDEGARVFMRGVDLSTQSCALYTNQNDTPIYDIGLERCKVHASTVLAATATTITNAETKLWMHHCATGNSSAPELGFKQQDYWGTVEIDTTTYALGGDGTTPYSIKMDANSKAIFPDGVLIAPVQYVTVEGGAASDGPPGDRVSSRALPLATPTALTVSAQSWTAAQDHTYKVVTTWGGATLTVELTSDTAGLTNADFWVEVEGFSGKTSVCSVRCYLAKASTTVYVDAAIAVD